MKAATRNLLIGYGVFCGVTTAIHWYYSGARAVLPGANALADLNAKLLPLNILTYLLPSASPAPAAPAPAFNATNYPGVALASPTDIFNYTLPVVPFQ